MQRAGLPVPPPPAAEVLDCGKSNWASHVNSSAVFVNGNRGLGRAVIGGAR